MKRLLLTYLILMLGLGGLTGAVTARDDAESNRERWDAMNKEERDEIIEAYRKWRGLDEGRRETIRRRYRRFRDLPEEERDEIIEAYRKWKGLDESRRETIRKRYRRFRDLPEEEKLEIAINVRCLRAMDPGKQRLVRSHLRKAAERQVRQVAVMRVVSLIRENNGGGPLTPERIHGELQKIEYRVLSHALYPTLTERQKRRIDAISGEEGKRWQLRQLAIKKAKQKLEENPPDGLPDRDDPAYKRVLHKFALRLYYARLVEHLPPSMAEMALFIRKHARGGLPREKLIEISNALKDGASREEILEKVQALLHTKEMERLIAAMPEKMRERYLSADFGGEGEKKRLQVIIMAFKPLVGLRPLARRAYFNHRSRTVHPNTPPRRPHRRHSN